MLMMVNIATCLTNTHVKVLSTKRVHVFPLTLFSGGGGHPGSFFVKLRNGKGQEAETW